MAKGNIFMGTLKGRIGDNVFYIQHGEQNVIKYQPNVSNPQTAPQMYQRSRFLAANKFYTRGRQAFFKFAFENKRKGESDFNAFMRENIAEAPNITRDAYQFSNYPIIGKFLVTRGSLPTITCGGVGRNWNCDLEIPYPSQPISTIGELSQLMLQSFVYQAGDIITLLFINTNTRTGVPSLYPSESPAVYGTPDWHIIQFKINTLDTTDLTELGLWYSRTAEGNLRLQGDEDTNFFPEEFYCGMTCVHSRYQHGKLKVSNARIVLNDLASLDNESQRQDSVVEAVIADWRTTKEVPVQSDVILKGALAKSKVVGVNVEGEAIFDSLFDLFSDAQGDINFGSPLLQPSGEYPIGYYKTEGLSPSNFSVVPVAQGTKVNLISFEQGPSTGVIRAKVATPDSGDGAFYRYAVYLNYQVQTIYLGYIEFELAESQPSADFDIEARQGESWTKEGNTLTRNTPFESYGYQFPLVITSDTAISPTDFIAQKVEGAEDTNVSFTENEEGVLIRTYTGEDAVGSYSYEIYYNAGGSAQLVGTINFEVNYE